MKKILFISTLLLLYFFGCKNYLSKSERLAIEAAKIHKEVLTIDSHTDTPLNLHRQGFDFSKRNDSLFRNSKVDLPRMTEGELDAVFMAIFLSQGDRTKEGNEKAIKKTYELFETINEVIVQNSDKLTFVKNSKEAYENEKLGKHSIFIGIENGYAIGNDITLIKKYYQLGSRYITLCHTKNNDICDSSTDEKEHNGLSDFGKKVVQEMNRVGMMIDVSHISDKSFYDVVELSKTPVIASHSCVKAICDNPRNMSDEMLKKLAKNGGVVQICILSAYVKKPKPNPERDTAQAIVRKKYRGFQDLTDEEMANARKEWYAIDDKYPQKLATVKDVVDHIDYVVNLVGIDYVGIGTDFDGGGGVKGCYDVSQMGNITLELVRRGYTKEQIEKIWGGNLLRVLNSVEKFSKELSLNN
ncbi:MAG: dipeptidase [Saprospiraceae bacterium]|nr:dipeptidase [Saprospiraceae bacterium]